MRPTHCIICGTPLVQKQFGVGKRYCEPCRVRVKWAADRKRPRGHVQIRDCKQCGKTFSYYGPGHPLYCSMPCKFRQHNQQDANRAYTRARGRARTAFALAYPDLFQPFLDAAIEEVRNEDKVGSFHAEYDVGIYRDPKAS